MRKRTSSGGLSGKFNMEMGSNIDLSLLRRPLTPFTGFQEARSAFDKGTAEVRHLLLYECGLIYECNVCRNMFRSLANFISHKRVFCCTSASKDYASGNNSGNGTDGIHGVRHHSREYKAAAKHETELRQKLTESVEDNTNNKSKEPPLVNEVIDVEAEEEKCETKTEPRTKQKDDNAKPTTHKQQHKVREIPTPSYVFQCPSCSLTFLKSTAVILHLGTAHNIPIRRIRMMRDSLLKRRAESTSENVENPPKSLTNNRELKSLLLMNESSSSSSAGEDKKDSDDQNPGAKCFFCQKIFERRAVLATHMQNCALKNEEKLMQRPEQAAAPNGKRIKVENAAQPAAPKEEEAAIATDIDCQIVEPQEEEGTKSGNIDQNTTTSLKEVLEVENVNQTFADLENQSFGSGLKTLSIDKLDISAGESSLDNNIVTKTAPAEANNEEEPEKHVAATAAAATDDVSSTTTKNTVTLSAMKKKRIRLANEQSCRCKICGKQFNALSNLRRHISMFHYRSRKFGCALCDYCAFRRYDIINHLNFVHKLDTENSETMSKDLVRVNDVTYTKDDMNDDIILCSADEPKVEPKKIAPPPTAEPSAAAEEDPNASSLDDEDKPLSEYEKPEKRQRRRHNKCLSAPIDSNIVNAPIPKSDVKLTRQKLKRSQSQTESTNSSSKVTQKRPKRIRTKAVNKDFVYDLSALVKKDGGLQQQQQPSTTSTECETNYQLRGSKRRNTINVHFDQIPPVPAFDFIKVKQFDSIKGSARRAALLLVSQGHAASSTLPEIPAERPLMRPRLTSTQRSDSQAGPIIETTELEAARAKSLPLCDDSYLEKIAKESVGSFTIRPCLEQQQQHSALDSLLQKFDSTKQINGITRNGPNRNQNQNQKINIKEEVVSIKEEQLNPYAFLTSSLFEAGNNNNDIVLSALPSFFTTPEQNVPKPLSIPTKPQKRLPSLDRLNETINSFENFYNAQLKN